MSVRQPFVILKFLTNDTSCFSESYLQHFTAAAIETDVCTTAASKELLKLMSGVQRTCKWLVFNTAFRMLQQGYDLLR